MKRLAGALLACALALVAEEARADDHLDEARSPFMPEFHGGLELHSTTLPGAMSLCTPAGKNDCPTVRGLGSDDFRRGQVTHGAFDFGSDLLGVGPVRFGFGLLVGFGDGPTSTIGGDAGAPGVGLSNQSLWKSAGVYGLAGLRLRGDRWAGYVEVMPTALELWADVSNAYPALRVDGTVYMLAARAGFTVPATDLVDIGPSFSLGTAFGSQPIVDVSGGLRFELRINRIAEDREKRRAQAR
jgi:hypothetical protein